MALTRLNFARQRTTPAGWRLALMGVGLLALAASGVNWIVKSRSVEALQASVAAAQPRRVVRAPLSADQQRIYGQQEKILGAAVRELNLPVTRLVKTVQSPPDIRVALLGLDVANKPEPGEGLSNPSTTPSGSLKISAEADTAQDMMNYVAYLNEQRLFTSVYLVKHEMNEAQPNHPYRFQMEATWRK